MKPVLVKATKEILVELEKTSACVFEGAGGDLNVWMLGVNDDLQKLGIRNVETFYTWNGKLMNEMYGLTGTNAYQDDITFFGFGILDFNEKEIGHLALWKLQIGARWMDDIVDNNKRRQEIIDGRDSNTTLN